MKQSYSIIDPRLPSKRLAGFLRLAAIMLASLFLILELSRMNISYDAIEWAFIAFMGIWLVLEVYWLLTPYIKRMTYNPKTAKAGAEVVLFTPDNRFFRNHRLIREILQGLVLFSSWFLVIHLAIAHIPVSGDFLFQIYILSMLILTWFISGSIHQFGLGSKWWIWLLISIGAGSSLGYAFWMKHHDYIYSLLTFSFCSGVAFIIYITLRIDISKQVWSEVLSELNIDLLPRNDGYYDWQKVVNLIHERLRYERVSILLPTEDNFLIVAAECGYPQSDNGKKIPAEAGITGRALRSGEVCAWNDVRKCSYYLRLVDEKQDQTSAEIAIPILHQGDSFGVLDIQSHSSMVFSSSDITSLTIIGRVLGAALFTQRTRKLLDSTSNFWADLLEIESENEVLDSVANFAIQELGTDVVTIYYLTPSGYPSEPPKVYGKLNHIEAMQESVFDFKSPLFQLIGEWKFYCDEEVDNKSVFSHVNPIRETGFTERENVRSAVFIPIGTSEEKLAVVFLNYRHKKNFDDLFKLMVQGFSHTIAMFLGRKRFEEFLLEGIGRPEFGIHTIIGRYGFKDGVMQEATELINAGSSDNATDVTTNNLYPLLKKMDNFIVQVRAQKSKDISTWRHTLQEAVDLLKNQMMELTTYDNPVRFIRIIDPRVERETSWTKLALFRLIDEAVNNAIYHGHATEITIQVERREHSISALISNNGISLPFDAIKNKSARGIYSITKEIEELFHAHARIETRADGTGTLVKAEIPALPILKKEVNS